MADTPPSNQPFDAAASIELPHKQTDRPPLYRSPPEGPCNYKELSFGPQAPSCGCRRFFSCSGSDQLKGEFCACGHHGCFHSQNHFVETSPKDSETRQKLKSPVRLQLVRAAEDRQYQLLAGHQPVYLQTSDNGAGLGIRVSEGSVNCEVGGLAASNGTFNGDRSLTRLPTPSFLGYKTLPSPSTALGRNLQSVPCVLDDIPTQNLSSEPQSASAKSLSHEPDSRPASRQVKEPPPILGSSLGLQASRLYDPPPLNRNSSQGTGAESSSLQDRVRNSPSQTFLRHVLEARKLSGLQVPVENIPDTAEDILGSATEVIPSTMNTPDLNGFDEVINKADAISQKLSADVANVAAGYVTDSTEVVESNCFGFSPPPQDPTERQRSLQGIAESLQNLLTCLHSVRGHLSSYPNVHSSIQGLSQRVDALENVSFSFVAPEEFHEKLEFQDARLIELENRLEDDDRSSERERRASRGAHDIPERGQAGSFTSSHSAGGSSMNQLSLRPAVNVRIDDLEDRVGALEAVSLPSYASPWEIEVVILPFGRDSGLHGIWYLPEDVPSSSMGTSHNSQEWTTAGHSAHPLAEHATGWTSAAIRHWADSTDEWLVPRACGQNSLVYKRLQSRGFVRKVSLTQGGAREIQSALVNAFADVIDLLQSQDEQSQESHTSSSSKAVFLGLDAPLIPLRKIHKSSRLQFLNPAEMLTPTSWTAEFLASSTMMKAAGGQKRLFMTHREAYLQRYEDRDHHWTWQRLRELPRVRLDKGDAPVEGGRVLEADAKEPCWAYRPGFDPPPTGSFSSNADAGEESEPHTQDPHAHSPQLTGSAGHSRSTPVSSSLLQPLQPISPLSEFPEARLHRTVSIPSAEGSHPATIHVGKRGSASFEAVASSSKSNKKRRLTRSPSGDATARMWAFTPRRSREPTSPFVPEQSPAAPVPLTNIYATPHSGLMFEDTFDGYDTNAGMDDSDQDDVWEGVDEEETGIELFSSSIGEVDGNDGDDAAEAGIEGEVADDEFHDYDSR